MTILDGNCNEIMAGATVVLASDIAHLYEQGGSEEWVFDSVVTDFRFPGMAPAGAVSRAANSPAIRLINKRTGVWVNAPAVWVAEKSKAPPSLTSDSDAVREFQKIWPQFKAWWAATLNNVPEDASTTAPLAIIEALRRAEHVAMSIGGCVEAVEALAAERDAHSAKLKNVHDDYQRMQDICLKRNVLITELRSKIEELASKAVSPISDVFRAGGIVLSAIEVAAIRDLGPMFATDSAALAGMRNARFRTSEGWEAFVDKLRSLGFEAPPA